MQDLIKRILDLIDDPELYEQEKLDHIREVVQDSPAMATPDIPWEDMQPQGPILDLHTRYDAVASPDERYPGLHQWKWRPIGPDGQPVPWPEVHQVPFAEALANFHASLSPEDNEALSELVRECDACHHPMMRCECPDAPDIRPAAELTEERLRAWESGWCYRRKTDRRVMSRFHVDVIGGREILSWIAAGWNVEAYPIRNGDPWNPASWDEVDDAVRRSK